MSRAVRAPAAGASTGTTSLAIALTLAAATALVATTGAASAQSLEREIRGARDGWVLFEYATDREVEICEDGGMRWGRSWTRRSSDRDDCAVGVAQVRLRVRDGVVSEIDIGPPSRGRSSSGDTNLGERDPQEVADYFLGLARQSSWPDVAENAIMPAVIAYSVTVWPELDDIARDNRLDGDVRESAVFWLGQAGVEPSRLVDLYVDISDHEMKEQIIFALSQSSHEEEAVEELMEIALGEEDRDLQKSALFWLGQSDDPRVADFLLELIRPRVVR